MVARRAARTETLPRRLFTVDEYDGMVAAGILRAGERVELLEGEIIRMAAIGARHMACVTRLDRWFSRRLPDTALVRVQGPIRLSPHSEPEPDLAIVRWREDFYADAHPGPADVLLLIEVADTSLAYDRDVELPLYAAAGIPEVWIADLAAEAVRVHRAPRRGSYTEVSTIAHGDTLAPLAFPELAIAVDDVLGPHA